MTPYMSTNKEWYETWFDSPYYPILYGHRDEQEAEYFLDNLLKKVHLPPSSRILDLACGRGRHCIYLSKKGFDVTGLDISEQSINYAMQFQNEKLEFFLHDMRHSFRVNYYDLILNIFTSFGYFRTERENRDVLRAVALGLKKGGLFVLDFMNSEKVAKSLVKTEKKTIKGTEFLIERSIGGKMLVKKVTVNDCGKTEIFTEQVMLFTHADIINYLNEYKLSLVNLYGDYSLKDFDVNNSERVIFIAEKK